ncbi:MAG: anthranilate synthase component I family protein [Planctomycetota bacterium]|nr:anthranilate synthase component I family protein [Planctomycetota bacterium]
MSASLTARVPLLSPVDPTLVVRAWAADRPLAAWGLGDESRWSRWAIIAEPVAAERVPWRELAFGTGLGMAPPSDDEPPFSGGSLICLPFDAGYAVEPAARDAGAMSGERADAAWLWRCPRALCFDKQLKRWWRVGAGAHESDHSCEAMRALQRASEVVRTSLGESERGGTSPTPTLRPSPPSRGELDASRARFLAMVTRARELIFAGDVYQVNLAHRLDCTFAGSPRALLARLLADGRPWYGALMELPTGEAIVSASPELHLSLDAKTRSVTTRPMKGTRPLEQRLELHDSGKDGAELAMIVDLMRNDLGRVCEFGSVRVESGRELESHGPLSQGVGTVSGRLRDGLGLRDLIESVFPAGSVTGAPKIRAMQIIQELEQAPRGVYCGSLGFLSDCGNMALSVAIRTAFVRALSSPARSPASHRVEYWIGAGIVADSDPEQEWIETLLKSSVLLGERWWHQVC